MCVIFRGFVYKGNLEPEDDGYVEITVFPTRDELLEVLEPGDDPDLIVEARIMVELEDEAPC